MNECVTNKNTNEVEFNSLQEQQETNIFEISEKINNKHTERENIFCNNQRQLNNLSSKNDKDNVISQTPIITNSKNKGNSEKQVEDVTNAKNIAKKRIKKKELDEQPKKRKKTTNQNDNDLNHEVINVESQTSNNIVIKYIPIINN